jgi:hypothetical protein
MTLWPLTHRGPAGGLHAYRIEIGARRVRPPAHLPVHDGHDWLYILDGRLRLLNSTTSPSIRARSSSSAPAPRTGSVLSTDR